jgi:hypothetical protein
MAPIGCYKFSIVAFASLELRSQTGIPILYIFFHRTEAARPWGSAGTRQFGVSISTKIIIGLTAVRCGLFFGELMSFMHIIGKAFVQLLQMAVLPYVTVAIIQSGGGIGHLGGPFGQHQHHGDEQGAGDEP